jgi:hypothetical protein
LFYICKYKNESWEEIDKKILRLYIKYFLLNMK